MHAVNALDWTGLYYVATSDDNPPPPSDEELWRDAEIEERLRQEREEYERMVRDLTARNLIEKAEGGYDE